MVSDKRKLQHLHLRATFGVHPAELYTLGKTPTEVVDNLFKLSANYTPFNHMEHPLGEGEDKKEASNVKVLLMILRSQKELKMMANAWLTKMAKDPAQLREKMTFFWHNHFATHVPFSYLMQAQNNVLRKHALGSFKDLLFAIAKDPAMIVYLNNQQNKKNAPNENFAREVMELFTLGIGNYTEKDIKEAARCFTGWHINKKGEFEFNAKDHDDGTKTLFGKTGKFGGEDVLNMLLENKQTARFVATKVYKEFVNNTPNDAHVTELADVFYTSGYDISKMLRTMYTAPWFYNEANVGTKITSPIELYVRYVRTLNLVPENDRVPTVVQNLLGQKLFNPPNVAGWPGGRAWIDSSSMLMRSRMPLMMFGYLKDELVEKDEYEDMTLKAKVEKKRNKFTCTANWEKFGKGFKETDLAKLTDEMVDTLLQTPITPEVKKTLVDTVKNAPKAKQLESLAVHIMALPQYQLI